MNDEAAKLRRELDRYRLRLRSNTGLRTCKVLRALVAQIEARLREIGNNSSRGTVGNSKSKAVGRLLETVAVRFPRRMNSLEETTSEDKPTHQRPRRIRGEGRSLR